jgi:GAF domain-containing protein
MMRWLTPPVFEDDDEKTRIARLLHSMLLIVIIATSLAAPFMVTSSEPVNRLPLLVLLIPFILLNVVALILLRRGYVSAASYIFLIYLGTAIFASYAVSEPGSTGALVGLTIIVAYTNVLLGARAVFRLTAFIVVFMLVVTLTHTRGWITPVFTNSINPISNWISNSLVFVLTGLGIYLSSVSLKQALDNSLASRKKLETTNQELAELQKALEIRVSERTADLEKRAAQLQIVSSVARKIASVQDTHTLLPEITNLVSEQFGFYHAGIFLIDEKNEYAVLQAANSEGGKRMLARQHKLALDFNSLVGYAASLGEPRVALDVGTDAVYFNNPDLPDTRSEMTLPLRIGGQVIGVLDVQSTQTNAFNVEDINVLTVLADQVAIAIENSRLFSDAKNALSASQAMFEKYVKQEWSNFGQQAKHSGFVYDGKQVTPLNGQGKREQSKHAAQTGSLTLDKTTANISVPIKLRGQTIGMLDVRPKKGQRQWTQDELAMLEAAAERAALALENARLVESAQRGAARERAIGEISAKIGSVSDRDLILQAAVEELGRKIGNTEIVIELNAESK